MHKKSLRFAFSLLAMLSFSSAWAVDSSALSLSGLMLSPALLAQDKLSNDNVPQTDVPKKATTTQEQKPRPEDEPRINEPNAPQLKSEFQDFVTQSAGYLLPIYGHDLFSKASGTFKPIDNIPVTPDYLVGPGDELLVHWWGQIEGDTAAVVDRNGMINLPKVGQVSVVGVRYQNLQAHLITAISKNFRNFELDVSLGKLRSIQVFVVGQATRPGNYTVSSLSTLVNAIFATGGPSAKGSMRHIQLKRNGKVVTDFDMYDLLLKGDKSKDVQLISGDVIYIPTIGAAVAIAGSVNTPAIFELKGNETLADLISLSGGLTNVAAGKKVSVERIHEREIRKVDEFQLDNAGLAKLMQDGDLVTVRSISAEFDNAVTLRGNVAGLHAGRHPWKEGLRISDIIPNRAALVTDSYWVKKNQAVDTNDNIWFDKNQLKQSSDNAWFKKNQVLSKQADDSNFSNQNKNQNQNQNKNELTQINNAGDLIEKEKLLAISQDEYKLRQRVNERVAEVNWDYAAIERLDRNDLRSVLIPFNLGKAMLHDAEQDVLLQAGDVVTIYSKDDIQVPSAQRNNYVILEGEVVSPGLYQVRTGETLRQLVERVGGVTPQAYLIGSEFSREATRIIQQKRLDDIVAQMDAEIQRTVARRSSAALSKEAADTAFAEAESQKMMVAKMKKVKASGRIVLEMPEYAVELKNIPDIELENGDRLYIPSKPSTVSVMGTVYNQNAFIYKKGLTVADYLAKAGGATRDGDDGETYLIRADGLVYSKRQNSLLFGFGSGNFDGRKAMPGDTVVVPEKLERYNLTKDLRDWSQIFFQFAIGIASMKTIGVF